jgi:hypothetical protein
VADIARDMESLKITMSAKLNDTKDLAAAKKNAFEQHVKELTEAAEAASEASQFFTGVEERITKAIAAIDELLRQM